MGWDAGKLEYWSEHYKRWQTSGLTQNGYCEQEMLSLSSFARWNKRIRSNARKQEAALDTAKADQAITLVPVRLKEDACNGQLVLQSRSGWQLQIPSRINAQWLAEFLKKLS